MARGKHKARAARRRMQSEAEAARVLQAKLERERKAREKAEQRRAELVALQAEVSELENDLAHAIRSEVERLAEEISAMEREIASFRLTKQESRENARSIRAGMVANGQTFWEKAEADIGNAEGCEVVVTVGVHNDKLPLDAVKAIQRARGLRRPGVRS